MTKRILSLLLVFIMTVGVLTIVGSPTAVVAATAAGQHAVTIQYGAWTYNRYNPAIGGATAITKVTDGNTASYWRAGYQSAGEKVQIILDLGSSQYFNQIDITFKTYNTSAIRVYGADRLAKRNQWEDGKTNVLAKQAWTGGATPSALPDTHALDTFSVGNDAIEIYRDDKLRLDPTDAAGTQTLTFPTVKKRYVMIENEIAYDFDESAAYQLTIAEIALKYNVVDLKDTWPVGNLLTHINASNETAIKYWTGFNFGRYVKNPYKDWHIYPWAFDTNNKRITDPHFMKWSLSNIVDGDSAVNTHDAKNFADPVIDAVTGKIKIAENWWGTFDIILTNPITGSSYTQNIKIAEGNYAQVTNGSTKTTNQALGKGMWVTSSNKTWGDAAQLPALNDNTKGRDSLYAYNSTSKKWLPKATTSVFEIPAHSGASGPAIYMNSNRPYNYVNIQLGLRYSLDGFYYDSSDTLSASVPSKNTNSDVTLTNVTSQNLKLDKNYKADNTSVASNPAMCPLNSDVPIPINTRTHKYFQPRIDFIGSSAGDNNFNDIVEVSVEYLPASAIQLATPETIKKTVNGTSHSNYHQEGYYGTAGKYVRNSDHQLLSSPVIYYLPEDYMYDADPTTSAIETPTYSGNYTDYYTRVKVPIYRILGGFGNNTDYPYYSREIYERGGGVRSESPSWQGDTVMRGQIKWYLGEDRNAGAVGKEVNGVKLSVDSENSAVLTFTERTVPHTLKLTAYWDSYGMITVQDSLEIPVMQNRTGSSNSFLANAIDNNYTDTNGDVAKLVYSHTGYGGLSFYNAMDGKNSQSYMTHDKGTSSDYWVWGEHSKAIGAVFFRRVYGQPINKVKVNPNRYNTEKVTVHSVAGTALTTADIQNEKNWRDWDDLATSETGGHIYAGKRFGNRRVLRLR